MRAFLGGVAAMVLIAVIAAVTFVNIDYSTSDRATSERGSVRLDNGS